MVHVFDGVEIDANQQSLDDTCVNVCQHVLTSVDVNYA